MIRGRGLLSFTRKGRQPLTFSLAAFESHSVFDPRAQGQESGTERNRKNGEIKDALKTLGAEPNWLSTNTKAITSSTPSSSVSVSAAPSPGLARTSADP